MSMEFFQETEETSRKVILKTEHSSEFDQFELMLGLEALVILQQLISSYTQD